MENKEKKKHKQLSTFFTSFFTSIVVSAIAGYFAYSSTVLSTKVDKQKAYIEFLQHKMNKLEEVQKLFDVYLSGDDLEESLKQQARIIDQRTEFVFTTYSYLFTHHTQEFEALSTEYASNSLDETLLLLPQRYSLNNLFDTEPDKSKLKTMLDGIFNMARKVRGLISDELADTYSDFEKLTMNKKDTVKKR